MKRPTPAYREIHKAADAIEPRMARAFRLAIARLKARFPMAEFKAAVAANDMRRVEELIAQLDIEDAFKPSAAILNDALLRGGRIAAEEL